MRKTFPSFCPREHGRYAEPSLPGKTDGRSSIQSVKHLARPYLLTGYCSNPRQQSIKKLPVVLQANPEVFGGCLISARPLFFQVGSSFAETIFYLLDGCGHQLICFFDGFPRLINKVRLNVGPLLPQEFHLVRRNESCYFSIDRMVGDFSITKLVGFVHWALQGFLQTGF